MRAVGIEQQMCVVEQRARPGSAQPIALREFDLIAQALVAIKNRPILNEGIFLRGVAPDKNVPVPAEVLAGYRMQRGQGRAETRKNCRWPPHGQVFKHRATRVLRLAGGNALCR